jgi:hypothetical protein
MTTTELSTFFDSYDEMPHEDGKHFFDANLWTSDTNGSLDLLQLQTICMPSAFLDCIQVSDAELL